MKILGAAQHIHAEKHKFYAHYTDEAHYDETVTLSAVILFTTAGPYLFSCLQKYFDLFVLLGR